MRLQTNPSPSPTPNHSPNPNPNPNLHPNQLCINFTNERLLQLCLHDAFVATRAAYAAEGVPHASIAPPPLLQDNAECVNMLQGRLFPLLTEVLPPPPSTSLHLLPSPSTSSHFPPPPTVSPPPPPPCFHSHPPSISLHLPSSPSQICLLDHAALQKDGADPSQQQDTSALAPTDVKFCESAHASEAGGPLLLQPYQIGSRLRSSEGFVTRHSFNPSLTLNLTLALSHPHPPTRAPLTPPQGLSSSTLRAGSGTPSYRALPHAVPVRPASHRSLAEPPAAPSTPAGASALHRRI